VSKDQGHAATTMEISASLRSLIDPVLIFIFAYCLIFSQPHGPT